MTETFKALAIQKLRESVYTCNWLTELGLSGDDGFFRLQWFPIMAGSVTGTICGNPVSDTGDGVLMSRLPNGVERWAGAINYLTGWVNLAPWGARTEFHLRYFYSEGVRFTTVRPSLEFDQ